MCTCQGFYNGRPIRRPRIVSNPCVTCSDLLFLLITLFSSSAAVSFYQIPLWMANREIHVRHGLPHGNDEVQRVPERAPPVEH